MRRLGQGEQFFSGSNVMGLLRLTGRYATEDLEARARLSRLTPREREVLQALPEGLSDQEIARRLGVSAETARPHMVRLLAKLEVDSRLQRLVFAARHGAITIA